VFPVADQSLKGGHHLGEIAASLREPFYLKLSKKKKFESAMNKIETITSTDIDGNLLMP